LLSSPFGLLHISLVLELVVFLLLTTLVFFWLTGCFSELILHLFYTVGGLGCVLLLVNVVV
jgi:hypothetical protein